MQSQNRQNKIVALPDPLLAPASEQLDKAAGAEMAGAEVGFAGKLPMPGEWLDALADGLSEHGWLELDLCERLPPGLLPALQNEVSILHQSEAMARAGIGRGQALVRDRSVRRDKIAWLDGFTEAQAALFGFLDELREGLNQRLFLNLKRFEAHYATYQPGDFYKRHLDSFRGRASRVVSLVLYLNDNWSLEDGGELKVFDTRDQEQAVALVRPSAGRAVLFLSEEVPHEVLPAQRTRFSIACWFRQDEVPLPL